MQLPGYEIREPIGRGGMGTVYLAFQQSLHRLVAIKVMAPALAVDEDFAQRFLNEGRVVAQLIHPNIVVVHDIGVHDNHYYLSMEYLPGGTLKQRIRKGLPIRQGLRVIRSVAEALGFAHERGFVHRDVKPQNILFRGDGTPVLTDFGIAKTVGTQSLMTVTGASVGSPKYMSPEQARGARVDARSDLYALGVILHEVLTGDLPYNNEDPFAVALMHVSEPIPRLPETLARFQPLIDQLMAKDTLQRYPDAQALVAALDSLDLDDLPGQSGIMPALLSRPTVPDREMDGGATGAGTGPTAKSPLAGEDTAPSWWPGKADAPVPVDEDAADETTRPPADREGAESGPGDEPGSAADMTGPPGSVGTRTDRDAQGKASAGDTHDPAGATPADEIPGPLPAPHGDDTVPTRPGQRWVSAPSAGPADAPLPSPPAAEGSSSDSTTPPPPTDGAFPAGDAVFDPRPDNEAASTRMLSQALEPAGDAGGEADAGSSTRILPQTLERVPDFGADRILPQTLERVPDSGSDAESELATLILPTPQDTGPVGDEPGQNAEDLPTLVQPVVPPTTEPGHDIALPPERPSEADADGRLGDDDDATVITQPGGGAAGRNTADDGPPPAPAAAAPGATQTRQRVAVLADKPSTKRPRRWLLWAGAGLVAVLLLAPVAWWLLPQSPRPDNAGRVTIDEALDAGSTAAPTTPAPEPVTDTAAEPVGPEAAVADLLDQAEGLRRAGRLTAPPGDNARDTYYRVLERDADNTQAKAGLQAVAAALMARARTLRAEGELEQALGRVEEGLAIGPALTGEAHSALEALAAELRFDQAEQRQETQEAADRQAVQRLLDQAYHQRQTGRLVSPPEDNALSSYQQVLELNPDSRDAREGLQQLLTHFVMRTQAQVDQGDLDGAEDTLRKGLAVAPDDATLLDLRRQVRERQEAARSTAERIDSLLGMAAAQELAGQLAAPPGDNALESYDAVLQLDPDNAVAREGRDALVDELVQQAQALMVQDPQAARQGVEAGLRIRPDGATLLDLREQLADMPVGDEDAGLADLKARFEAHIDAWELTSGRGGHALGVLEELRARDPDHPFLTEGRRRIAQAYAALARSALRKGELERARGWLAKGEQVRPGLPVLADLERQVAQAEAALQPEPEPPPPPKPEEPEPVPTPDLFNEGNR